MELKFLNKSNWLVWWYFIASTSHPTLSTIRQDTPALAKTACDLLLDLMNKEDNTEELQKRYVLPVEIIRRESTA